MFEMTASNLCLQTHCFYADERLSKLDAVDLMISLLFCREHLGVMRRELAAVRRNVASTRQYVYCLLS